MNQIVTSHHTQQPQSKAILQPTPPRKLDLTPIPSCVSFVKAWDLDIEKCDQKTQNQQIQ
jgi:hypothetical protein